MQRQTFGPHSFAPDGRQIVRQRSFSQWRTAENQYIVGCLLSKYEYEYQWCVFDSEPHSEVVTEQTEPNKHKDGSENADSCKSACRVQNERKGRRYKCVSGVGMFYRLCTRSIKETSDWSIVKEAQKKHISLN